MSYTKREFLVWKGGRTWEEEGIEESAYDLYRDYERWTEREGLIAAPLGVFSHWLQAKHKKIKKEQANGKGEIRRVWYEGIRLKPPVLGTEPDA